MRAINESLEQYEKRVEEMSDREILREIRHTRKHKPNPPQGWLVLLDFLMTQHIGRQS